MNPDPLGLLGLGAWIALDQVSVAQLQLAHPLVAGALAGALLGHVGEGALVGALLGLVLAGHRPVGGIIPPDGGVAAVVAAASFVGAGAGSSGAPPSGGALLAALLCGLVLADLGRCTEAWTRARNLDLLRHAEARATAGALRRAIAGVLGLAALRGALTVALALPLATWLVERAGGRGPAAAAVVALAGGVGIAANERLLGARRGRGLALAALGVAVGLLAGGGR